ncbi:uncharacterized protein LOC122249791 [Penaeus japonicus]|uniref:uncharacterized protein LOC122249791 n=1 Tax=Penaeus japonicus TaxID=27405 RepID=UPI001C710996|nr:uncharacterized protein LOC122249791 [Penaeus japonicus]
MAVFSILLMASFVAAVGGAREEAGRLAFLAMVLKKNTGDMRAMFHAVSENETSYRFEFRFLFTDRSASVSVKENEAIILTSESTLEDRPLLLEITQPTSRGFFVSLRYPSNALEGWSIFVETETEIQPISETEWTFDGIRSRFGEWLRAMVVSGAGEEISVETGNGTERKLNSTGKVKVDQHLAIRDSLQSEGSSSASKCVSFHFRNDDVCEVKEEEDCKALDELTPCSVGGNDEIEKGFWQQQVWICLSVLFSLAILLLALLFFKGHLKPCSPPAEDINSYASFVSLPNINFNPSQGQWQARVEQGGRAPAHETPLTRGSLLHSDAENGSKESVNSEYFRIKSEVAASPEAPTADDCSDDAVYSHLVRLTTVPFLDGIYEPLHRDSAV